MQPSKTPFLGPEALSTRSFGGITLARRRIDPASIDFECFRKARGSSRLSAEPLFREQAAALKKDHSGAAS